MENVLNTTPTLNAANGGWISAQIDALRAWYERYTEYRQTVAELSALSDRGLADLGLSRAMIRDVAWAAADAK